MEERNLVDMTENVDELATEETVEVETTTEPEGEETVKTYTEEELNSRVDEILAKKIPRKEAKIRKEYEKKFQAYKEAEAVLNAGLGTSDITEATNRMREFYEKRGVEIPQYNHEPSYSDEDIKVLASNEAQKIIESGFDEVIEEADRLADLGVENMNPRERHLFIQLTEYVKLEESKKELAQIGVNAEALEDSDFKEFESKLNPNLSTKDKYELYLKLKPKSNVQPIGSMKGTKAEESAVKDFYSYEEAMKFTKADFDKNPELFKAVERSMTKW